MSNRFKAILAVIAAIIIVIVIWITPAKTFLIHLGGNIFSPISNFVSGMSVSVSNWFTYMGESKTVYQTNAELQKEIDTLKNKLAVYSGLESENERLSKLLEIKNSYADIESTGAEIIARDSSNWFTVFTIDKGTNAGIQKNQPVLCANGLVGHTTDVGANWAKVVSLIDTTHSASGMVVRSGDYVQIDGEISLMGGGLCKMTNITEDADVIAGDVIVTSGIGGVYPKDIVIGTVLEFRNSESGTGSYAIIKPAVDFQKINEVLVLKVEAEANP